MHLGKLAPLSILATLALGCSGELAYQTLDPDGSPGAPGQPNEPGEPGEPGEPAFEPGVPPRSRVVRLDGQAYLNLMATFLDGRAPDELAALDAPRVGEPFTWLNPADRFTTRNRSYMIDQNDFALVELDSRLLADAYIDGFDPASCFGQGMGDDACQRAILAEAGDLLLRRPLGEAEVDALMAVVPQEGDGDDRVNLHKRLRALLMHPEALFRVEIGADGEPGSVQELTPTELASALSFTLTNRPPDAPLYQAALDGTLADDAVFTAHARRLLDTPEHRARVLRFVKEFWRHGEATNVAKDVKPERIWPEEVEGARDARYRPERFVAETDLLLEELVSESLHDDFLATMLTTPKGYVSKDTAIFYNTSSESGDPEPVEFDPSERKGVMMQPAWLVSFSEPDHNSPIRRGLFIQESLLCGVNPEVPIEGVPPLEVDLEVTLREQLGEHLTTETSCGGCHLLMDPLAMPLEQFDMFGRYRTEEAGAPVQTDGALTWSGGEFAESGPVADPYELVDVLARSQKVERCFVEHAFTFWAGREAAEGDQPVIERAARAYRQSGGDFDAALLELLRSDVFRKRTLP